MKITKEVCQERLSMFQCLTRFVEQARTDRELIVMLSAEIGARFGQASANMSPHEAVQAAQDDDDGTEYAPENADASKVLFDSTKGMYS